ncbi:MAG: MerR family transcriptional regulator [Myxococcota bacterium]
MSKITEADVADAVHRTMPDCAQGAFRFEKQIARGRQTRLRRRPQACFGRLELRSATPGASEVMEQDYSRPRVVARRPATPASPNPKPQRTAPGEPRGSYPMRVVTRLTGLNPDTIRAWERRYGAISPERTGGNTRLFSAADVKRLALLRDIVALGHPVSRVANLETAELERLLKDDERQVLVPREEPPPVQGLQRLVDEYLEHIDRFEARRAQEHITRTAALLSTREYLLGIAVPVLQALPGRWPDGSAQAHLARCLLVRALASFPTLFPTERGAPRVLVASTLGPAHDAAVLLSAIFAQLRGLDVVCIGTGLEDDALLWAIDRAEPAIVILGVDATAPSAADQAKLDELVRRIAPRTQVWRGGSDSAGDGPNVRRFATFEALEVALVDVMHRA